LRAAAAVANSSGKPSMRLLCIQGGLTNFNASLCRLACYSADITPTCHNPMTAAVTTVIAIGQMATKACCFTAPIDNHCTKRQWTDRAQEHNCANTVLSGKLLLYCTEVPSGAH
jgi:hypothetical protein